MEITKIDSSNDCGGFRPPKGKLDTQMYPECQGTETDRNIVKKTVEKRKKLKKKKASDEEIIVEAKERSKKKKKDWDPNPWAVCTESIGGKEGTNERSEWSEDAKERYERCVMDVKKQQAFNLKEYKIAAETKKRLCEICGGEVGTMTDEAWKKMDKICDICAEKSSDIQKD